MSMYFDEARRFGQLLLTSEQAINLAGANAAFEKDEDAKEKMRAFNEYRAVMQEKVSRGAPGREEVERANEILREMVSDMRKNPVIDALLTAEAEFNEFINQVLGILRMTVGAGESGGGCGCGGGSCAGAGCGQ